MNAYEDIQEESTLNLADYIKTFKRRKKQFFWVAGVVLLLCILAALFWPPTYRSNATILIEEQELPQEFVMSTITTFANQQIEVIKARVLTMKNIMDIVKKFELYDEGELARKPRTEIVQEFIEDTGINLINAQVMDPRSGRPGEATIAFSISYEHGNPKRAQQAANELTNLFLNENQKDRTQRSMGAAEFLSGEAEALQKELGMLEAKIADFKDEHKNSLPEVFQYNLSLVDRTDRELLDLTLRLKELGKRKLELESELAQLSPYAPTVLPTGEQVLSDYDRLKALESEYLRVSAVYNDEHPDVQRLQREIDMLRSVVGGLSEDDRQEQVRLAKTQLSELRQKYTPDNPKVLAQERMIVDLSSARAVANSKSATPSRPDNPAYVLLSTQLQSTNAEMKIIAEKEAELKIRLKEIEDQIMAGPTVEKEYSAMMRDYQNAHIKYAEIKSKLMAADVAKNLEQERKGQRFVLIEPAVMPEEPVSPNRPVIAILGVILAVGAGIGFVVLLEMLNPAVRGDKALAALIGAPPLVSVPYIFIDGEQQTDTYQKYYIYVGIAAAVLLIVLVLLHFFVKPLDVTWYVLLRKLGIG